MAPTKTFLLYLLVSFSAAILFAHFYFNAQLDANFVSPPPPLLRNAADAGGTTKVWPVSIYTFALKFFLMI